MEAGEGNQSEIKNYHNRVLIFSRLRQNGELMESKPSASKTNSSSASHYNAQRSTRTIPVTQHSRQASANQSPSYQMGSSNGRAVQESTEYLGSLDFLPSVNFDDFHASLTTDEPSLSLFPKPGNGGSSFLDSTRRQRTRITSMRSRYRFAVLVPRTLDLVLAEVDRSYVARTVNRKLFLCPGITTRRLSQTI